MYWDSLGTRDSALAHLREATLTNPDDGEAWFALGLFLTVTTTEKTSDWRERYEADQALQRAFRLLPGDPRPVAGLAVLRRKQGARTDAARLIRRALGMVSKGDAVLDGCYEAELYYQMALIYRAWWEDWESMTFMGGEVGSLKPCSNHPPRREDIPEEVYCPEVFYDAMSHRADLTSMRYDDRDALIENLEAAVAAYPAHRDARHALLLALYELQDRDRFRQALQAGLAADSLDPWLPLWGETEAFDRHDIAGSARFLDDALRLLPPAEREVLLSPERIVSPEMGRRWEMDYDSLFWRASDPLLLTDVNERLLAHAARVTYAAMKFDVPLLDAMGLDTDAGFMLVRYGRPWRKWMVGAGDIQRQLIWAMDSVTPPMRLQRSITMRRWRFQEETDHLMRSWANLVPERWDPHEAFDTFDSLPVEVARFEENGREVLDVYALWRNPYTDIQPDTLRVGFFLTGPMVEPLLDQRRTVTARRESLRLKFRAPLSPAQYGYRVETLTGPLRAAGRVRGRIDVTAPATDSLRMSDLLLGRSFQEPPRTIVHRDSLRLDPLYDLRLTPGDSLVVYWETYGLRSDSTGTVRYHVTLDAREASEGAVAEVIARLGAAIGVGRRSGLRLEWDVASDGQDGVRRDVLVMDPAAWSPGEYLVRVRIDEPASGRVAIAERRVVVPTTPP